MRLTRATVVGLSLALIPVQARAQNTPPSQRYTTSVPKGRPSNALEDTLGRKLERAIDAALGSCSQRPPPEVSPLPRDLFNDVALMWNMTQAPSAASWGPALLPTVMFGQAYQSDDPRLVLQNQGAVPFPVPANVILSRANGTIYKSDCSTAFNAKANLSGSAIVATAAVAAQLSSTNAHGLVVRIGSYSSDIAATLVDYQNWTKRAALHEALLAWHGTRASLTHKYYVASVSAVHIVSATSDAQLSEATGSFSFSLGYAAGGAAVTSRSQHSNIASSTRTLLLSHTVGASANFYPVMDLVRIPTRDAVEDFFKTNRVTASVRSAPSGELKMAWGATSSLAIEPYYTGLGQGSTLGQVACAALRAGSLQWDGSGDKLAIVSVESFENTSRCVLKVTLAPDWSLAHKGAHNAHGTLMVSTDGGLLKVAVPVVANIEANHSLYYDGEPKCSEVGGKYRCEFKLAMVGQFPSGTPTFSIKNYSCDGQLTIAWSNAQITNGSAVVTGARADRGGQVYCRIDASATFPGGYEVSLRDTLIALPPSN